MMGAVEGVFLVLMITLFILGNLGNGFIGLVNGRRLFRSKRISLSDFIITSLALSKIVLLWIFLIDGVLITFSYKTHDSGTVRQIIDIFWTFTNHLSTWLITCLGVLYCLKIARFSHPTFLWLKWRVSRVVVWMLLGTLLLSCCSIMSVINEFKINSVLCGIDSTGNVTEHFREKRSEYHLIHFLWILWHVLPLTVSLTAYVLLILSLRRHTWQMQQNCTSSRDPSTEAHERATRIILSFLLLFLLYTLSFIILSSSCLLPDTKVAQMIGEIFTMFYLVGHSFVLILGNNKLKQTFMAILPCKSGHLKRGSKGPSPHS
ncbi:taste receptor type 2 member 3-like [Marmota marmota marmota]|uniref:taste receptor type 2 member 3-like n=1 Tax=Marmota marmota marmota TaxID=9994 RepID=UPI000762A62D|nr:taste receptor type 2 member 3-like [Marmota marmota marmota]